jgi:hypothetical protein
MEASSQISREGLSEGNVWVRIPEKVTLKALR